MRLIRETTAGSALDRRHALQEQSKRFTRSRQLPYLLARETGCVTNSALPVAFGVTGVITGEHLPDNVVTAQRIELQKTISEAVEVLELRKRHFVLRNCYLTAYDGERLLASEQKTLAYPWQDDVRLQLDAPAVLPDRRVDPAVP